jgi:hypothetical protein
VLAALGVAPDDAVPGASIASIGRERMLVPLGSRSALAALEPDFTALRAVCDRLGLLGCYVYSRPDSGGRLAARMFAPSIGVEEDIANANSTACLAALLARQGLSSITVDMGDALGSPAAITAAAPAGSRAGIRLGGTAIVNAAKRWRSDRGRAAFRSDAPQPTFLSPMSGRSSPSKDRRRSLCGAVAFAVGADLGDAAAGASAGSAGGHQAPALAGVAAVVVEDPAAVGARLESVPAAGCDRLQHGRNVTGGEAALIGERDGVVDDPGADFEAVDPVVDDRCGVGGSLHGLAKVIAQCSEFLSPRAGQAGLVGVLVEAVLGAARVVGDQPGVEQRPHWFKGARCLLAI